MSSFLKPVPTSSPPKSRNTISPNTQSKSPHYTELQQGSTLQKSQQSLRNSHYTSKFEKSIDMDMKQSNTFINPEFEIKKLMNLVELQQHEINNWKRRYEQAEARCISTNQTQTMLEYEKHLDQLTKELKNSIQQNDELNSKLREKDTQLSRLNKQIDVQKQQLNDFSSELKYLQHEKLNMDKDASMQLFQKDQKYNQNLQEIQQAHLEQLQLMDDQIQKLQDELVRRNQAIEFQKQEIVQLDKIVNEMKVGEKNLMQQLEALKVKYQDLQEEKKREVNKLIQQNEQQVKSQEKEFLDEKECLVHRISQLQYENNILNQQILEQQNLIQGLQDEIQSQVEQNCNLQEQNQLCSQDLDQKYRKSVSEIKMEYQQQINKLLQEIQKVNQQLDQTQKQLQENQQLNQELQISLENLNQHNQTTTSQLKQVQNEYDSLQLQYENDIQEQNQEIEQLNDQVNQLTELLEQRSNEYDE
ncbi:unnamed protein product (macronuclear) [Paramecium tetraurelia]|uniref:Uncharacterized protein n=1 Tax=Paramecium tetraurelia TaxID=5888 RepID=A0E5B0_PARTE|nr:uncharacterized protein GSPATT00023654001 [Paramecium tetraurelia]CAK90477.1 unnamed protein product [Paramecium tetraurelia]|eukprot:XP_001457874.1 hypothetical protein (macronuclear) [Paramecium tetraurelia strain d4-2]